MTCSSSKTSFLKQTFLTDLTLSGLSVDCVGRVWARCRWVLKHIIESYDFSNQDCCYYTACIVYSHRGVWLMFQLLLNPYLNNWDVVDARLNPLYYSSYNYKRKILIVGLILCCLWAYSLRPAIHLPLTRPTELDDCALPIITTSREQSRPFSN